MDPRSHRNPLRRRQSGRRFGNHPLPNPKLNELSRITWMFVQGAGSPALTASTATPQRTGSPEPWTAQRTERNDGAPPGAPATHRSNPAGKRTAGAGKDPASAMEGTPTLTAGKGSPTQAERHARGDCGSDPKPPRPTEPAPSDPDPPAEPAGAHIQLPNTPPFQRQGRSSHAHHHKPPLPQPERTEPRTEPEPHAQRGRRNKDRHGRQGERKLSRNT